MTSDLYIQVAIPSPLRQTFDYKPPPSSDSELLKPGIRVQVPFGNRRLIGFITGCSSKSDYPKEKIKVAEKLLDQEPVIDDELLALYQWAASYYQFPIGQALQTSLPKDIKAGKPAIEKRQPCWQLTDTGKHLDIDSLNKAPRQQQIVSLLSANGKMTSVQLKNSLNIQMSSSIKSLEGKKLIEIAEPDDDNKMVKELSLYGESPPLSLNKEQQEALETIKKSKEQFNAFLLEGVTGSGKTEIYLQIIAEVLEKGKQVLVLVPEIGLTPQTIRRFELRFQRQIVAFHSGLTDNQRLSAWLRARNGKADIIIGTRSAIFTPLARPGLIIVDEEHDASYKQQDGFRYSGRDLAIYRSRQLNVPVILGTATPSLESLNNALSGRYKHLLLTERAGNARHPEYRLLDLKGLAVTDGFSEPLLDMIRNHIAGQNQALIFLNRRGFAPILLCSDCGWIATCPRCESSYTLHQHPPRLSCHHCEAQKTVMVECPQCSSSELTAMGVGTEKTEQALSNHFPDIPVYRIDRDSTRNREALNAIIEKVDSGDPCILVGTQMLSKGHHFPNVTLVAVLDADGGLFSADFRGPEQMGQLLIQVAGRAGRGETPGEVVIQTYNSTHPTMQALIRDGYGPFARKLLEERKLGKLPPFTYMALIRAEAANRALPESFLNNIRGAINSTDLTVLGPMPSPMEKRGGLYRAQLILEANKRSSIQRCLFSLVQKMENHQDSRKVRWSLDVDPLDFT